MKILALIPARGGSKRLPGKNIKQLGGRPLIDWSIDAAKGVPEICEILISTDDSNIASIAKNAGAYVPWLRPESLSSDTATSVDVALHALNWYEQEKGNVDGLLILQPTSPFRTPDLIAKAMGVFKENSKGLDLPIVGVSRTDSHPMWSFTTRDGVLLPYVSEASFQIPAQDLPPVYIVNGSLYLISPHNLRTNKSLIGKENYPIISNSKLEAIDIDTFEDFTLAEWYLERKRTDASDLG